MSLFKLAPIGILRYLYLLNGVPKVVSLLDSVSNLWLKNELVLLTTVKHFAPFNLCKTSSTSFALCLGLMIHLIKCVGSRHSLNLPFGLPHTDTKEFSHSISSEMSTLCKISSLTILSNSFLTRLLHCMGYSSYWLYVWDSAVL